ncbi:hypothetical protein ACKKBF_B38090 [Auxenochlorella protothecoides x Auxenochlorella symbiontica]
MISNIFTLSGLGTLEACCVLWYGAGQASVRLGAPKITGIMLAGVLVGPSAINLLTAELAEDLVGLEHACLALIALAAGMELAAEELARTGTQVVVLTLCIALGSWLVTAAGFLGVVALVGPVALHLEPGLVWPAASLCGTLALARSPASAIAVIQELRASGPFTSLVMAVTVLKDLLLFLCFAVTLDVLSQEPTLDAPPSSLLSLTLAAGAPLLRLLVSLSLGLLSGSGLAWVLQPMGPAQWLGRWTVAQRAQRLLSARVGARGSVAPAALVAGGTFFAAQALAAEPLLSCVVAGVVARNNIYLMGGGSGLRDVSQVLHAGLAAAMPFVNVLFFGLVGAHLRLGLLAGLAPFAVLLAAARIAGVAFGCLAGGVAGRVPPALRTRLWQGMVTQAGIALGLCQVIARRLPDWGLHVAALIAGSIIVNLLVGPLLFKTAILRLGEAEGGDSSEARPSKQRDAEAGQPTVEIPVISA